jgi:hypothetical protein
VKNFAFIMTLIAKLMQKLEEFIWTWKCQNAWETIKQKYVEAPFWIAQIARKNFMYI